MNKAMEDALRYISGELSLNPGQDISRLVQETCIKYNLDPMQEEFLFSKYVAQQQL